MPGKNSKVAEAASFIVQMSVVDEDSQGMDISIMAVRIGFVTLDLVTVFATVFFPSAVHKQS